MALAFRTIGLPFGVVKSLFGAGDVNTSVASAGSTITDATELNASMNIVTGADGTKGVKLPSKSEVGDEVWVFNSSASSLKVYPEVSTSAIAVPGTGLGSAGAAYTHTTFAVVVYKKVSATQWFINKSA